MDAFEENIAGVTNLISSGINKTDTENDGDEGIAGDLEDALTLQMGDEELLALSRQWESENTEYNAKIHPRQERNKQYYLGNQRSQNSQFMTPVGNNLIFQSEETFIPQALSQNPEPVVWSDNSAEGKDMSNDLKTMLQYHADTLNLRGNLGVMVRHWSIYFIGIMKHGWDEKVGDITISVRNPSNFLFATNGFIDVSGNFDGQYVGERIECDAYELIELFPKHADYIKTKVNDKLGTNCVRTEWWTDDYCFVTFGDKVLDKHKNEYFNYDSEEEVPDAEDPELPPQIEEVKGNNHFARPKMPYTFLSVFSLQEQPHDMTNLIEQNITNQDRINNRDEQIDKNLENGNNSIALSGNSFNSETARQAAMALQKGHPVLVPDGRVEEGIKRLPANDIPSAVFQAQENDKQALMGVFGTQGLSSQPQNEDSTARGMILNQSHDSSRIGGGIGDALERVADNIFNYWVQMYYVFYDEPHMAAIMGNGNAVEYVQLMMQQVSRKFVVSVSPNSMQPKDEITEQNLAISLAEAGWLDPINLFKALNYPDPMETAKMVTVFRLDPNLYMQMFFPQEAQQMTPPQGAPQPGGEVPQQPGNADEGLSAPPANPSLSQVPINSQATPQ